MEELNINITFEDLISLHKDFFKNEVLENFCTNFDNKLMNKYNNYNYGEYDEFDLMESNIYYENYDSDEQIEITQKYIQELLHQIESIKKSIIKEIKNTTKQASQENPYERLWKKYCKSQETTDDKKVIQKPKFETLEGDYEIKDKKSINTRDEKVHATFKKNVNKIMTKCPITGLAIRTEYAHIKPYSISKKEGNYNECYDGFNGIILYNSLHQLFDDGMITFKNDGSLLISSKMPKEELSLFSCLQNGKIYNLGFLDERKAYLEYHREHIFKK